MLTKLGISTTPLAMKAPRRATAPGTTRKPASLKRFSPQPSNLSGTLSNASAPAGSLNGRVRAYWNTHIHDLAITSHPVGSVGFFFLSASQDL